MADPQLPIGQEEADNDDSVFLDLLASPFRGVEGAVQGIYNLADFVAFDILPDYDEKFLGRSTTVAGSAVEGISQFMTGFVPIFGWAGRAGSAAKAGSMTQKALGGTVRRGVVAGAVTDFSVFNGQEARLSNFIQQYPSLQNPVTEFLAHDDEEGEIAGRLKNVLEGLGMEAIAFGFIKGLKAMKRGREIRANEGTPDDLYEGMQEVLGGRDAKLMPDFDEGATSVKEPSIVTEWETVGLEIQASKKEVMSALGKFSPENQAFLKALQKAKWLNQKVPSEAIDEFISNPRTYLDNEIPEALKEAAGKAGLLTENLRTNPKRTEEAFAKAKKLIQDSKLLKQDNKFESVEYTKHADSDIEDVLDVLRKLDEDDFGGVKQSDIAYALIKTSDSVKITDKLGDTVAAKLADDLLDRGLGKLVAKVIMAGVGDVKIGREALELLSEVNKI